MRQIYTLLFISTLILFSSCSEEQIPLIQGDSITLSADSDQLRSDGTDAISFQVNITDAEGQVHDVTKYSEIYLNYEQKPLSSNKFHTDIEGEYTFYAIYGMKVSNDLQVTAINDAPELPEDPQVDNLDFHHRMLLIQHTGATCSNCPRMMNSLRELASDASYNTLYHHVASHAYNGGDKDAAFSEDALDLSSTYNISGNYPLLTYNLTPVCTGTDLKEIKAQIDLLKKDKADVGIAASAKISGDDVLVNVAVKSAVEKEYRVAAWLLEDEIYSYQAGMTESWHNIHENALRYAAGHNSQRSFDGVKLGKLSVGQVEEKMFVLPLDNVLVAENCEVIVYVTAVGPDGIYNIVNCTLCQVGESVTYEYK